MKKELMDLIKIVSNFTKDTDYTVSVNAFSTLTDKEVLNELSSVVFELFHESEIDFQTRYEIDYLIREYDFLYL